jgi:glucokinase
VLGAAIAGLLHAFDPEIVIVGGNIAEAGEALFAPLRREVAWRTRVLLAREVPIVPPQVADKSGVIGAAALALFGCR